MSALEALDVRSEHGDVVALDDVTLRVADGECVALVGESGAGKTTLLRLFNRMSTASRGKVFVGGVDVASQPVAELRRRIGYVPQHGGLLPHWTVLRNVGLVPELLRHQDAAEKASRALDLVALAPREFGGRYPHELSGGQRQRVALARAIAARPAVLLMDEPFGALDAISRSELQTMCANLRRELGLTTLLVTHDLREAALLADEIVVMRAGRIEQRAPFETLRRAPATPYVASLMERAIGSIA
jgi:osmoprotectant transport system ATP-binding protein